MFSDVEKKKENVKPHNKQAHQVSEKKSTITETGRTHNEKGKVFGRLNGNTMILLVHVEQNARGKETVEEVKHTEVRFFARCFSFCA